MKSRSLVIIGMLLVPLLALTGWAQITTSRVDGVVTDASGGVVPTAKVALINIETQFKDSKMTNESGLFVFPQVTPGNYRITVERTGFKLATINDIKVAVNVPRTVDVKLQIGAVTETLEVTADIAGSLINTVNAEINTVVEREQMTSLPLSDRNPLEFALLQAGVTGRGDGARETSVNGTRGSFQNLTLDGINNQDNFVRTDSFFGVIPVRETFVEEFSITTSNSDVDAGMGSGQTKMVTRSGSNNYHGEAFYYHKNSALNANDFFSNSAGVPRDRILNHQYGFNVSGPILRNKLFFFVNWEEERDPSSASVIRTVLTNPARTGSFTYRRSDTGAMDTINLLTLAGVPADSVIGDLIDMTPLPNDTSTGDGTNTSGYRFNSPADTTNKWLTFKIDYNPIANHYISASLHQFRYNLPNDPFNENDAPFPGLVGGGQKSSRYLGSLSWRTSPRTNMSNELRFGAQYAPVEFFTNEKFTNGYQLDLPLIDNPIQNFMAQGRNAPVYDLTNNFNWERGNHSFKFGGGIRWTSADIYNDAGIVPSYSLGFDLNPNPLRRSMFPGGISASAFTRASDQLALLGGFIQNGTQTFNAKSRTSGFVDGQTESRIFAQRFFNWYASDTYRVTRDFSVNLGLRWEYHGVPNETRGLSLLPENGAADLFNANAILNYAGRGTGRPYFKSDYNNFSPTVGIAWKPFKGRSTVIRAGYSVNFVNDNNFTSARNAVAGNDGLSQTITDYYEGGTVGGGLVPITKPEFQVPRTIRDNILLDPTSALYAIDKNFRTPYVQQWTLSLQHEIFKDTAVEVRYVGNHGVKLARALDLNQVMLPQEFLDDFGRARRNYLASGDPYSGEELTIIPNLGLGGYLDFVPSYLLTNEIASYVGNFLAPNRSYFFAGEGGEDLGSTIPISYFYRNPNAFVADVLGNFSYSNYHALQAEVRRRLSKGLSFQVNYTFGKVLTDFAGSQTNFSSYMDNAHPELEKMRADFDITHTLNINFIYDLPFGKNRFFAVQNKYLDTIVGGWRVSGISRFHSGEVVNIVSQRGTVNRGSRSGKNTVDMLGMTVPQLQSKTGVYHGDEGRIYMFDPALIAADGTANEDFFVNPVAGKSGTLSLSPVSGPWYNNIDLGLMKQFELPLRDKATLEVSANFINAFNHTNFDISSTPNAVDSTVSVYNAQNINSTSFGLINSAFSPRQIRFGLKLTF